MNLLKVWLGLRSSFPMMLKNAVTGAQSPLILHAQLNHRIIQDTFRGY